MAGKSDPAGNRHAQDRGRKQHQPECQEAKFAVLLIHVGVRDGGRRAPRRKWRRKRVPQVPHGTRLHPLASLTWIGSRGANEGPGMRRRWLGISLRLADCARRCSRFPRMGQVGFDRPGGDYFSVPMRSGRSRPMCRSLRARPALPRLGLFLSRNRKHQCRVLAEIQGHAAGRIDLLRVRRAWHRRHRAARADRSSLKLTVSAATTGSSTCRPMRRARTASLPAKARKAVAPGPMCGRAISDRRRFAI